ncbi:YbhN family protein [Phytohabitans flavus]|uniref:lysylphosphatidylglycerol synthase transmembrane domain-containing protein n=1 Tax=Phytohabitans flavus TaxID=1076124 RepID=UPI0036301048
MAAARDRGRTRRADRDRGNRRSPPGAPAVRRLGGPQPRAGGSGDPAAAAAAGPGPRLLAGGAALRIRDWASALAYAVVNWVADIACFAATAKAFDLRVSLATLAAIYLAVQIVRQVPLTPGGAGIVDTAFIAGLTAAGATAVSATAAVLAYRLLSTWLLIPVGGAAAVLRRYAIARAAAAGPRSAQARADRGAGRPESVSVS